MPFTTTLPKEKIRYHFHQNMFVKTCAEHTLILDIALEPFYYAAFEHQRLHHNTSHGPSDGYVNSVPVEQHQGW